MKIGILSLQGDFSAHAQTITKLGHLPVLVKKRRQLAEVAGLIMPGGESTTFIRLFEKSDLRDGLPQFNEDGFPIFATCAGLILLAQKTVPQSQFSFGFIPLTVERNAYGSQKDSFSDSVEAAALGNTLLPCIFIRAPRIVSAMPDVEVLATHREYPILVRYRNILGATFHPELTDDLRVHHMFVQMCEQRERDLLAKICLT
jgi:5'-phosphate synthase pdxT subunit